MRKTTLIQIFVISFTAMSLYSCSQKSNSWTSKAYHNTTSHYNHYFIARETMKEAEEKLFKQNKDDYTRILDVYPRLDASVSTGMVAQMEEVIKKASVNAVWHKNSKWLDDSYNLIGKARMYKLDYANGLETYKYVNSKGADVNAKHTALVGMLRIFTMQKDNYYAGAVIDVMDKQELNKLNKKEYNLAKAHYNLQIKEYTKAEECLEIAVPLVKRGEKRAKIYYILGQLYQQDQNDSAAYANYRKCLRNNPNFEMTFYASLNKNSVIAPKNAEEEEKVMKYYKKLLADGKNKEYKDKIYYEMARFVFKRNQTPQTLEYLNLSVRSSMGNNFQKSASYLFAANIYYENLKKFPLAKAYYDSTLALMDKTNPDYYKYKHRSEILTDLVKQMDIIHTQDSLLRLAKLSPEELDKEFNELLRKQEEEAKRKEKEKELAQNNAAAAATRGGPVGSAFVDPTVQQGNWYFYDQALVSAGQLAFSKKWGNRPNTDYWRLKAKQQELNLEGKEGAEQPEEPKTLSKKEEKANKEAADKAQKDAFVANLPYKPDQVDTCNVLIRRAMFRLGNIYNLELEEPDNAIPVYENALERYPNHEKRLEIWYALYLIYKSKNNEEKTEKYKNLILTTYPNSIYAKLILNPNYLKENREQNEKAESAYKLAYENYQNYNYEQCVVQLASIKSEYKDNNINDKIDYLNALIIGKTQNAVKFKESLVAFTDKHKTSTLKPLALEQIEKCNEYIARNINPEYLNATPFKDVTGQKQLVIAAFVRRQQPPIEEINAKFRVYNSDHVETENYYTELDEIGNEYLTIVIKEFENKEAALKYYKLEKKKDFPFEFYADFIHKFFVITPENLLILKNLNNVELYLQFFNENYLK